MLARESAQRAREIFWFVFLVAVLSVPAPWFCFMHDRNSTRNKRPRRAATAKKAGKEGGRSIVASVLSIAAGELATVQLCVRGQVRNVRGHDRGGP